MASRIQGEIRFDIPGYEDVTAGYGSGGYKRGSMPPGTWPINTYNPRTSLGLQGWDVGAPGGVMDDPRYTEPRKEMMIHLDPRGRALEDIRSAGCLSVAKKDWPALRDAIQEAQDQYGSLVLTLDQDGSVTIKRAVDAITMGATEVPRSTFIGAAGEKVKAIQQRLVNAGYSIDIDGKFGNQTERAVRQFQRERGLQVDGIVGPETTAALNAVEVAPAQDLTRATVRNIQTALNKGGFGPLQVDGKMGDNTRAAVEGALNAEITPDSSAEEIRALQAALRASGVTDDRGRPIEIDGSYGPLTTEAVDSYRASTRGANWIGDLMGTLEAQAAAPPTRLPTPRPPRREDIPYAPQPRPRPSTPNISDALLEREGVIPPIGATNDQAPRLPRPRPVEYPPPVPGATPTLPPVQQPVASTRSIDLPEIGGGFKRQAGLPMPPPGVGDQISRPPPLGQEQRFPPSVPTPQGQEQRFAPSLPPDWTQAQRFAPPSPTPPNLSPEWAGAPPVAPEVSPEWAGAQPTWNQQVQMDINEARQREADAVARALAKTSAASHERLLNIPVPAGSGRDTARGAVPLPSRSLAGGAGAGDLGNAASPSPVEQLLGGYRTPTFGASSAPTLSPEWAGPPEVAPPAPESSYPLQWLIKPFEDLGIVKPLSSAAPVGSNIMRASYAPATTQQPAPTGAQSIAPDEASENPWAAMSQYRPMVNRNAILPKNVSLIDVAGPSSLMEGQRAPDAPAPYKFTGGAPLPDIAKAPSDSVFDTIYDAGVSALNKGADLVKRGAEVAAPMMPGLNRGLNLLETFRDPVDVAFGRAGGPQAFNPHTFQRELQSLTGGNLSSQQQARANFLAGSARRGVSQAASVTPVAPAAYAPAPARTSIPTTSRAPSVAPSISSRNPTLGIRTGVSRSPADPNYAPGW